MAFTVYIYGVSGVLLLLMSFVRIALQSVELDRLAVYLDSDIIPWNVNKAWEDLLPSEWFQVRVVYIIVNSEGYGFIKTLYKFLYHFKVLFGFNYIMYLRSSFVVLSR